MTKIKLKPKPKPTLPTGDPFSIPKFLDRKLWTPEQVAAHAKAKEHFAEEEHVRRVKEAEERQKRLAAEREAALAKRPKAKAKREAADAIVLALGNDELTFNALQERMPDMPAKLLSSGLRYGLAASNPEAKRKPRHSALLVRRKLGSRFVFMSVTARQQARQTITSTEEATSAVLATRSGVVPKRDKTHEGGTMPKAKAKAKSTKAPKEDHRISDEWQKVLKELGAHKDGLSHKELTTVCTRNKVAPWWGRFIKAGFIDRPKRGHFVLTKAGTAAVA